MLKNQSRKKTQDAFGYKYNITSEPSFYEVSESEVVEPGFNSTGEFISTALMAFVEGIIEDLQGWTYFHIYQPLSTPIPTFFGWLLRWKSLQTHRIHVTGIFTYMNGWFLGFSCR